MFDRILVPLDGSPFAESAIPFAEAMPCRRVLLLYVEPPESRQSGGPGLSPHSASSYLEQHAQTFRHRGRDVERAVDYGDPAERIVDMAGEVNLIVMASHARGGGGRLFFGEYADRVARHAPAPTLLVRGGDHTIKATGFTRVVVPLDGSAVAEESLPVVRRLAASLSVPIHLVQVAPPALADQAPANTNPDIERYFRALVSRLDTGMPVRWDVRHGDPACELIAHVGPSDLVAMTTHGEGGVRRWQLGSVAEKMVRRAPAPVMLIRDGLQSRTSTAITESTGETGTGMSDWWQNPGLEGFDASRLGESFQIG
jgi:nucleotide-binding universal stress UspA family protein